MTYRWTPTAGCSTTTACATDQVSGNNAFQSTSGNLPSYASTCGPNSTPCLTFNGTSDYIQPTTPIASSGATTVTLYAVINVSSFSANNHIFGGGNFGFAYALTTGAIQSFGEEGVNESEGTDTFSTGTWYTVIVTYNNGTTTTAFYKAIGGSLITDPTSLADSLSWSASTTTLGAAPAESVFFNGKIAEWGYLNSVNTTGIANWSLCHYGV